MPKKGFLDQIRAAVDQSGLSRYAICKRLDIDQAAMSRFMNGIGGLSTETLGRLGDLLNLEVRVRSTEKDDQR